MGHAAWRQSEHSTTHIPRTSLRQLSLRTNMASQLLLETHVCISQTLTSAECNQRNYDSHTDIMQSNTVHKGWNMPQGAHCL